MKKSFLKYLILGFLSCYTFQKINAQITNLENFDVWLQGPTEFHPALRIDFAELKDSTFYFSRKGVHQNLPLHKIANLYIREKGKIRKNALVGAGIGLVAGITIALIDGPSIEGGCLLCLNQKEKLWIYSLSFGGNGLALGALLGSLKVKIPINSKYKRKHKKQKELKIFSHR